MNQKSVRSRRFAALLTLLLCLGALPVSAQGFKWWHSDKFKHELQLAPEQIARIEEVFQASVPEFRQHKRELDRLESELSRLIDASGDEAEVMQQADRVEAERTALSKARTLMLLRIRRVLTAEQRVRLTTLHQEWERNRKRQDRHN